ncbi:MAG TPA: hypothetical protein VM030_07580 [Acidimicrobiales bacterium]|nr:hypothetical protein [Acidimicrobiales bacterium]
MSSGIHAAQRLGAGGEAEVWAVPGRPQLAAKRYRRPTAARAEKLRVMLAHPPDAAAPGAGPVAVAWPRELLTGADGTVDGFLMPRVDLREYVSLFQLYNPQSRAQVAPAFDWRYLLRTARNVASLVDVLHRAGYVIGDLNESNLLVSRRALVALVDCDSLQVRDPDTGVVHRCTVAKPEFTAPEFQRVDLAAVDRTTSGDDFALAVVVVLLLMQGTHPYAGVWRGRGEPPDLAARMRARRWPYRRLSPVAPPPLALPLRDLPAPLRRLARRTFVTGAAHPRVRPPAAAWVAALDRVEARLRTCGRSAHHLHAGRRCPWCAQIARGLPDPFPGPSGRSEVVVPPPPVAVRLAGRARAATRRSARRAARWSWDRSSPILRSVLPAVLATGLAGWVVPVATSLLAVVLVPLVLSATSGRRGFGVLRASARPWARVAATALVPPAVAGAAGAVRWSIATGSRLAGALATAVLVLAAPRWVERWHEPRGALGRRWRRLGWWAWAAPLPFVALLVIW